MELLKSLVFIAVVLINFHSVHCILERDPILRQKLSREIQNDRSTNTNSPTVQVLPPISSLGSLLAPFGIPTLNLATPGPAVVGGSGLGQTPIAALIPPNPQTPDGSTNTNLPTVQALPPIPTLGGLLAPLGIPTLNLGAPGAAVVGGSGVGQTPLAALFGPIPQTPDGSANTNFHTVQGLPPIPTLGGLLAPFGIPTLNLGAPGPAVVGGPGLGQTPIAALFGPIPQTPLSTLLLAPIEGNNGQVGTLLGLGQSLAGYRPNVEAATESTKSEDVFLTFAQLATKYGYPVETHYVTTKDGYILTMQRIPFSRKTSNGTNPNPKPLLLSHGLTASSDCWIISPPAKNLAFTFADAGYDVWFMNFRGSGSSLNHTYLLSNQTEFWDFSLDHLGRFDLPAIIDYILKEKDQPDLYFIGHSMGATAILITLSLHPEYNEKIRVGDLWAPAVYMTHSMGPLRILSSLVAGGVPRVLVEALSFNNTVGMFGLNDLDMAVTRVAACGILLQNLCTEAIFSLFGYDAAQLNVTQLPVFAGHVPSTSSVYTGIHYAQFINSGRFAPYDAGFQVNLNKYGSVLPPEYDLKKVTTKLAIKYGQNDFLAAPADVLRLAKVLPNVVEITKVDFDSWNHLDFVIGIDALELVVYPSIEFLNRY